MIKPTDLRIGNYIRAALHLKEKYAIVKTIKATHVDSEFSNGSFYGFESYYKDLNPLLLTDEWLIEFGFEKQRVASIGSWDEYNLGNINISNRTKEYVIHFNDGWDMVIKYVHQLQNINYLLNGKELILKTQSA